MDKRVIAAWVSVGSNTTLVVLKLLVGFLSGSVSIISEAIHSANDLLASFIALFAVKTSSKPPDKEHPYGHGKVENVSGTIEAVLIFAAAVMIIKEAVTKLRTGGEVEQLGWGIAVMGFSALLNFGVSKYLMFTAKKTKSIALEADAMHLTTDVLTSFGVFAGLILIKLTGYTIIDPIAAIIVACIIIKAAWDLTRKAFTPLLDSALSEGELGQIHTVMIEYQDQFIGYHELRTRRAGRECYIDLHLVTCPDMSVRNVHDLCDEIERRIMEIIPYCSILIHVEPHENDDECSGQFLLHQTNQEAKE
ncbi:MAG: cation diffusion facilitator family transporter [Solirubrobacterales bacterium]